MIDVICLGEALIDVLPTKIGLSLKDAPVLRRMPGGAPANLAVGLARLGVKSAFLGKLGNDPFGHFLYETLQQNGVDVTGVRYSGHIPTGLTFGWVDDKATGEPHYFFYDAPRADYFLEPDEIDWQWFKSAQIYQFSSTSLAKSPVREATLAALHHSHQNGQLVSYDVNIRLPAWSDRLIAREKMLEPLPFCTIVKLNQHELTFLTGQSDLEAGVKELWQPHLKALLVTLGSKGCYYKTVNGTNIASGFKVKVADAVGSGDGWMAGFLAKVVENSTPNFDFEDTTKVAEACRFANAVGALTATKPGAMAALPTLTRVNRFLKQSEHNLPK